MRDAAIIANRQKVEMMGHEEAAQLLQQTLDEEGEADKKLTEIAMALNPELGARSRVGV